MSKVKPGTSVKKTGTLKADPELRYAPTGFAVCTFNIQKDDEEHKVVCFGDQAIDIIDKYNLKKDSSIIIWGYFSIRKWTGRNGEERQSEELRIRRLKVIKK